MSEKQIKTTVNAFFDILGLWGIPTNSIQELWNQHQEKVLSSSRDVLLEEIEKGNFNNVADDDKISILHRYTQAAMNGVARINLRLLAKAINSLIKGNGLSKTIYANEFNRYASSLESLSNEEIHLLANMYQYRQNANPPCSRITPNGITFENDFIQNFAKHYKYEHNITDEQYKSMCCALLRTGFLYPVNYVRDTYYALSPVFDEIVELVDFQDAFDKEKKSDS